MIKLRKIMPLAALVICQTASAAVVSDSQTITVKVTVPARLDAQLISSNVNGNAIGDKICVLGKGAGQFRVLTRDHQGKKGTLAEYSSAYPVMDSREDCDADSLSMTDLQLAARDEFMGRAKRLIITAE